MMCSCHLSNVYGNRSDVASLFLLLTIRVFFFFPPKKGPAHDPCLTFLLLVSSYGWDLWGPGDHPHEPTLPFWDHAWTLRLQRSHTDPADFRACTDVVLGLPSQRQTVGTPRAPWTAARQLWVGLWSELGLAGSLWYGMCWGGGQGLCPHHPIFRHRCARSLWLLDLNLTFFVVRGAFLKVGGENILI